jgi:hypothetical protein
MLIVLTYVQEKEVMQDFNAKTELPEAMHTRPDSFEDIERRQMVGYIGLILKYFLFSFIVIGLDLILFCFQCDTFIQIIFY